MATAKKLPSGSWSVNIYIGKDENGKRKYKRFTGPDKRRVEREAAAYADEHRGEVKTDTFGYAANCYIASKKNILSPTTINGYKKIKANYLTQWDECPIHDINSRAIQSLVNEKAAGLSPKTIRNIYGFITAVIYSVDPNAKIIVTLPPLIKKFKELPKPQEVIRAVQGTTWELPALLAMWLSLRMSEIRGLRYEDISGNVLTVRNVIVQGEEGDVFKSRTKTYNSARRLSIPDYLMKLIYRGETNTGFVVPYTHSQIYKGFQNALKTAGLPPMPFHDLRHMNASIMLMLGIPDIYTMEQGGWSSTNVLKGSYWNIFNGDRLIYDQMRDNFFIPLLTSTQHENASQK